MDNKGPCYGSKSVAGIPVGVCLVGLVPFDERRMQGERKGSHEQRQWPRLAPPCHPTRRRHRGSLQHDQAPDDGVFRECIAH